MKRKLSKYITIKKVNSFHKENISEVWVVNPKNMAIIFHSENLYEFENLNETFLEKSAKETPPSKFTDKLYFGRSTGMGKVIRL